MKYAAIALLLRAPPPKPEPGFVPEDEEGEHGPESLPPSTLRQRGYGRTGNVRGCAGSTGVVEDES